MQPTSSGNNPSLQTERTAKPNRSVHDDSASTIRVDAPSDAANVINAPHGPVVPARTASGRVRGERPKPLPNVDENPGSEAIGGSSSPWPSAQQIEPAKPFSPYDNVAETADVDAQELNWKVLHAEDISRLLDQRLFEIERRERLLNRRAAQISQHERMFRLWANETRQELERKRRELQQFEAELIQRSNDVRWLLVHGDRFDNAELSTSTNAVGTNAYGDDFRCSKTEPQSVTKQVPRPNAGGTSNIGGALEDELKSQIEELEFARGKDGLRRPTR